MQMLYWRAVIMAMTQQAGSQVAGTCMPVSVTCVAAGAFDHLWGTVQGALLDAVGGGGRVSNGDLIFMHVRMSAVLGLPAHHFVVLLCSIDNDLVQEDSEFKGSRQFGMSYANPQVTDAKISSHPHRLLGSTAPQPVCRHKCRLRPAHIPCRVALPRLAQSWTSRATRPLMTAGSLWTPEVVARVSMPVHSRSELRRSDVLDQSLHRLAASAGTQRFRILKVLQQKPVVIAECEILDEPDEEDSVEVPLHKPALQDFALKCPLALHCKLYLFMQRSAQVCTKPVVFAQAHVLQEEVSEKFRALWQLSNKLRKQPVDAVPSELGQLGRACWLVHSCCHVLFIELLRAMASDASTAHIPAYCAAGPKAFSYWVAGMLGSNSQSMQQLMLQEDSIIRRCVAPSKLLLQQPIWSWRRLDRHFSHNCTLR
jgi:hypothetical protein